MLIFVHALEATQPERLLAIGIPMGMEWIVILFVALLIFGRRLPDVMRSMGRGVVEFKRGIKGIEDDVEAESHRSSTTRQSIDSPTPNESTPRDSSSD